MMRDHSIYEIDYDVDVRVPIDGCGANGYYWEHRMSTFRIVAPTHRPELALAYVQGQFKRPDDVRNLKLSKPRVQILDAFIEEHTY